MQTYQLTDAQIDRIIGIVENSVGAAVRDAVLAVIGHDCQPKKRQGRKPTADKDAALAKRIILVLGSAPTTVQDAPEHLRGYLALKSMPKTMLRNRVGNGYKNFDAVLQKLVDEQQVMTGRCPAKNKRYMILFGLP
jgi:hypothetical protein